MDENNKTAIDPYGDVDAILPDGWDDSKDFFEQFKETDSILSDGVKTEGEPANEGGPVKDEAAEAPTTDEPQEDEQSLAVEDEPKAPPDETAVESPEPTRRVLHLQVNHQSEDFDVNAASDEELTALLQKARAFDAKIEAERKAKYREVYNRLKSDGYPDELAATAAQNSAGGHTYPLEDVPETVQPERETVEAPTQVTQPTRDFTAELQQVKALFPDLKEMPQEVMNAYNKGASLINAYAAYKVSRNGVETAKVRKENKILKQNAAATAKAPVRGASGGGKATLEAKNPFEEAFLKGLNDRGW